MTTTPLRSHVVVDATVGKSTEFRFEYVGSNIGVSLVNPSGAAQTVSKEGGVNAFVFKPSDLAMVSMSLLSSSDLVCTKLV